MFVLFSRVFFVPAIFLLAFCFNQNVLTPKDLYILHLPIWETHVYGLKSQTKQQTEAFWSIYSLSGGYYQHQLAIYLPPLVGFRKEFRYRLQVTILTLASSGWPLLSSWIEVTSNVFLFFPRETLFPVLSFEKVGGTFLWNLSNFKGMAITCVHSDLFWPLDPQLMRIHWDQQRLFLWKKTQQCFLAVVSCNE